MKYDGGAAFPTIANNYHESTDGMSLRDYFAGQALMGFCSMGTKDGEWTWDLDSAPNRAYELADRMLAERAKGEGR
jgi:hypothetical protein